MRDLVRYYRHRFRYFINLTGQEFPLRSNLELVRIARIFNGSNDIAGSATRYTAYHPYQPIIYSLICAIIL